MKFYYFELVSVADETGVSLTLLEPRRQVLLRRGTYNIDLYSFPESLYTSSDLFFADNHCKNLDPYQAQQLHVIRPRDYKNFTHAQLR